MPIDPKLLEILCCPNTHASLTILAADKLKLLNENIAQSKIKYADGNIVEKVVEEALITEDGQTVYRVDNEIPVMLPEKGIHVQGILF